MGFEVKDKTKAKARRQDTDDAIKGLQRLGETGAKGAAVVVYSRGWSVVPGIGVWSESEFKPEALKRESNGDDEDEDEDEDGDGDGDDSDGDDDDEDDSDEGDNDDEDDRDNHNNSDNNNNEEDDDNDDKDEDDGDDDDDKGKKNNKDDGHNNFNPGLHPNRTMTIKPTSNMTTMSRHT